MIDTGQATDVGRQRDVNQDSAGVAELRESLLLVVADGMGGHVAGEQAARIVIESMFDRFEEGIDEDPRDNLYFGVQEAHKRVMRYGDEHDTVGMGSTAVAACIKGDDIYVAHVGDSRLYLFRDGRVAFKTKDHTKVQIMLELGTITAEEALHHPEGNIITRAVGHERMDGKLRPFEADVLSEPLKLQARDSILMCSDGLYDLVSDEEMIRFCSGRPAQEACDALVRLANERGGHDNITVVILHCAGGTPPPMPGAEPFDATPEVPLGSKKLYLGPSTEEEEEEEDDEPPNLARFLVVVLMLGVVLAGLIVLLRSPKDAAPAPEPVTEAPSVESTPAPPPEPTPAPLLADDDDSAADHDDSAADDDDSAR